MGMSMQSRYLHTRADASLFSRYLDNKMENPGPWAQINNKKWGTALVMNSMNKPCAPSAHQQEQVTWIPFLFCVKIQGCLCLVQMQVLVRVFHFFRSIQDWVTLSYFHTGDEQKRSAQERYKQLMLQRRNKLGKHDTAVTKRSASASNLLSTEGKIVRH